jgi:kelch repeat/BTB domain-containing protein 3
MASSNIYSSKKNSLQVLSCLNSLRYNPQFSDIVLLVGELRIPAQRCVLAAFSDYFRAMFQSDLSESLQVDAMIRQTLNGKYLDGR